MRPYLNKLGVVVHVCDPTYEGGKGREDLGQRLAPGRKQAIYLKNKAKKTPQKAGGMIQIVESF
jgi:hypothetical protein